MKRWLFFDIDDTLWDFRKNSLSALILLYENSDCLKGKFPSFDEFSEAYHQVNDEMWRLYAEGRITSDFLKTERFRRLLNPDSTSPEDLDVCLGLNNTYLHTLCRLPNVVDGAEEVLQALEKKYMIGAVTNGFTDTQYTKIYTTGLWRHISRMIISDEIGIQKPDVRYFDYVMSATGATPEESIVIGDNPDNDVKGALDAGIDAIFYNPAGKDAPTLAPYRCDSILSHAKPAAGKGRLVAEIKDLRELLRIL